MYNDIQEYMIPTQLKESEFSNDRLTDLILQKDDEPTLEHESSTEPEKSEEWPSKVLQNENLGALHPDNNACWFPIHFSYQGIDYSADVKKIKTRIAEYHVFDVIPAIDHFPEPFVVAEHFSKEKYDFPVNEIYYPITFGTTILKVINDGSNDSMHLNSFKDDL